MQGAPHQSVMWVYIDVQRTHELHVGLRKTETLEFLMRERSLGADEVTLETALPLAAAWESKLHHTQLEERLTLLGSYYRHSVGTGGGWTPVRRPTADTSFDLKPLEVAGIRRDAQFYYYGSRHDDTGTLLVVGVDPQQPGRSPLARLDFVFPHAQQARLSLVHPSLPPVLLRSTLAATHLDLRQRGLEKVPAVDRGSSANKAWCEQLDRVLDVTMNRIAAGAWGGLPPRGTPKLQRMASPGGAPPPPPPSTVAGGPALSPASTVVSPSGGPKLPARVLAVGDTPRRLDAPSGWKLPERLMSDDNPYEIEYSEPESREREPVAPVAKIEENTLDFRGALTHPRILALHQKYLAPGEEESLFAQGEIALRAAMKAKRQAATLQEQHLLSILEASLLVRYALRPGGDRSIDPRAADLLRRALVYIG
ncbi:MAG TPA: hypothetical protein VM582_08225 [Candidatus Thermoplasmatota archaeon]|nr:hypothetical protein [Candidatus Thermoplasmatota archaeon]